MTTRRSSAGAADPSALAAGHSVETAFLSGGSRCAGSVVWPPGEGPHPAVVVGHGCGCRCMMRLRRFVDEIAARRLAVLATAG